MSEGGAHLLHTASNGEREVVAEKMGVSGDTATVESIVPLRTQAVGGHKAGAHSITGSEVLSRHAEHVPPSAALL